MSVLEEALKYLRLGYTPIPIQPRDKRPLVNWREYQDNRPDEEMVRAWFGLLWPQANVALVTGQGYFVIDLDKPNPEIEALIPPESPCVITSKGRHYYLKGQMSDKVGILPGVDIRGVGYALAPPSIHPGGHVYAWQVPLCHREDLPPCPYELRKLLAGDTWAGPKIADRDWITEALEGVNEGTRDQTCARLAGYLWRKGLPETIILGLLKPWARACVPPFPDHEVQKTVESICKREGGPKESLRSKLRSVKDLYKQADNAHHWIWEGWIPTSSLVLLASEEKIGKSTFTYALASAVSRGMPFLEKPTNRCDVLILAVEESSMDVKLRARRFGLTEDDRVSFIIGDVTPDLETYAELHDIITSKGIGLVILDTLGHHVSGALESENDNAAALRAIKPWLNLARDTTAAVILVHHKGKGQQSYRGASAIGGIVDQIIAMREAPDNQRILETRGRYSETPRMSTIELINSSQYRVVSSI